MSDAVDVGGFEVEVSTDLVQVRLLSNPPVGIATEVVLVELATADVDRAVRAVVIVVSRALRREPADKPDVDVGVAIELVVEALGRVVPFERLPKILLQTD